MQVTLKRAMGGSIGRVSKQYHNVVVCIKTRRKEQQRILSLSCALEEGRRCVPPHERIYEYNEHRIIGHPASQARDIL